MLCSEKSISGTGFFSVTAFARVFAGFPSILTEGAGIASQGNEGAEEWRGFSRQITHGNYYQIQENQVISQTRTNDAMVSGVRVRLE